MPQTDGQSCKANGGGQSCRMLMSGTFPDEKFSDRENNYMGYGAETHRRRNDLTAQWQTAGLQADGTWGGQKQLYLEKWWDYEPGTRCRHELSGFGRHRAGVTPASEQPTCATGKGGVFSNQQEKLGGKSIFNKEKYLPLVYTPFLISHYCCHVMKKRPMKAYQHKNHVVPFLGTLAAESRIRKQAWIRNGCNAFDSKEPKSQPLSFWTEQDILRYIVEYGLDIAPVYGEIVTTDEDGNEYAPNFAMCEGCTLKCTGADRTGCIFCGFGFHCEKGETRFQRIARTHPRQYEYCMGGGQWADNPFYDPTAPEYDGDWKNWNPPKIWVPSKKGLGMRKVFEMTNEIYGKDFYRYE